MKSLPLRLEKIKKFDIKTFTNSFSERSASILIIFLCIGFLVGCVGDMNGPEINFSDNFPWGEIEIDKSDFTVGKIFQAEFPIKNHLRVNIDAISGEVMVTGRDDTDSVSVTALKLVGSDSQLDAEMHIDDLGILVNESASEILIKTIQPKKLDGREYRVEYDIIVPSNFEVVTTQVNGSIMIINIENSVEVSNTNGDVQLSDIVGGVAADVVNGSIECTVILPINDTIDLFTDNGSLELSIPTSVSAELSAYADQNGKIIVSNLVIKDSNSTKQSLTGTIGNGEGSIELGTVNGNIKVIGFDDV